ncbi:hypothetical protein SISSUDRAFT_1051860 [Sistotremastrum suecicum HHB10207 ss-3]|uniref:Uncharacterized protein n=1 Tax=Sistotremastrum suecicum HHB10207 ss-3 TaxID=1314776 RepID=A0A166A9G4_9AGAM|nr:hypothetical protein SISSUDRAFT_1051860 [Sistotremastrum suecicum HHB10207 ss-3]
MVATLVLLCLGMVDLPQMAVDARLVPLVGSSIRYVPPPNQYDVELTLQSSVPYTRLIFEQ